MTFHTEKWLTFYYSVQIFIILFQEQSDDGDDGGSKKLPDPLEAGSPHMTYPYTICVLKSPFALKYDIQ